MFAVINYIKKVLCPSVNLFNLSKVLLLSFPFVFFSVHLYYIGVYDLAAVITSH